MWQTIIDIFNFFSQNTFVWTSIVSAVSFIGGGVCKFFYDREFSERAVSTQKLLNKFGNNRLGSYGRKRLRDEAVQALSGWQAQLAPPVLGDKLQKWPKTEMIIVAKSTGEGRAASRCPRLLDEPPSQRPLYIEASTGDSVEILNDDAIVKSVIEQIKRVAENHEGSEKLVSFLSEEALPARVWVFVSTLRISEIEDLHALRERLAKQIRAWIPTISLSVEAYLPDDIHNSLEHSPADASWKFIPNTSENVPSLPESFLPSAAYANARSMAFRKLKDGTLLDLDSEHWPSKYRIHDEILETRFARKFKDGDLAPDQWNCLAISGPPGSGKTEFAKKVAAFLQSEYKHLIVALSTGGSLAILEYFANLRGEPEQRRSLKDAVRRELADGLAPLMPPNLVNNLQFQDGFVDAFLQCIKMDRRRLVLLVDDVLPRTRLINLLTEIVGSNSEWKLHLILIGRPKLDFLANNGALFIDCNPWGRGDATKLLTSWAPDSSQREATQALKTGWAANRENFSTYHLRVLSQQIDQPDLAPSTFMLQQLEQLTAPLSRQTVELRQDPTDLLYQVRELLEAQEPREAVLALLKNRAGVGVVELLGQISWNCKYEPTWVSGGVDADLQVLMNPSRLQRWSGGRLQSYEEAQLFVHDCAQVGIFRKIRGEGGADWIDNFIADGFAAHFLSLQLQKEEVKAVTIADMAEKLHERNSLDILPFALSSDQLIRLISAVIKYKPNLTYALKSLFEDGTFASWLIQEPALADELIHELLKVAKHQKLGPDQIGPIGVAFAALVNLSDRAAALQEEQLGQNTPAGRLSLASLAAKANSVTSFYEQADARAVEKILSTEISLWFARENASPEFSKRIIDLITQEPNSVRAQELWRSWCSSIRTEQLPNQIYALLEDRTANDQALASLFEIACKTLMDSGRGRRILDRDGFVSAIHQLHQYERFEFAKVAVRWLACLWYPEVCASDDQWRLSSDGKVAIQTTPNPRLKVSEIFAKFRVSDGCTLPSSKELHQIMDGGHSGIEVVSDGFPKGFAYSHEIKPGQIKCLDKGNVRHVELTHEVMATDFDWRVRMIVS